jgi:hypothetical protein
LDVRLSKTEIFKKMGQTFGGVWNTTQVVTGLMKEALGKGAFSSVIGDHSLV